MTKEYKIEIEKRTSEDNVKYLRSNDIIPGVYYSHDSKDSILFKMIVSELRNAIKSGAAIFQVSVGGKLRNVIFKSVQYHPVQETVQHIDLYGVDMNVAINIRVPLILVGECIGVKEDGGVLNTALTEIEISCLPSEIPQSIEADITELRLGDSLQVENLSLGEGLSLVTSPEATIASVTHAAVEVEPEVEEDELDSSEDSEETEDSSPEDANKTEEASDNNDSN